jgi:hypothetical protein
MATTDVQPERMHGRLIVVRWIAALCVVCLGAVGGAVAAPGANGWATFFRLTILVSFGAPAVLCAAGLGLWRAIVVGLAPGLVIVALGFVSHGSSWGSQTGGTDWTNSGSVLFTGFCGIAAALVGGSPRHRSRCSCCGGGY